MSENEDKSQKTEEPTQRKLEQAREKGQIAKSQEINHWFIILALAIVFAVFAEYIAAEIAGALRPLVENAHALPTTPQGFGELMLDTFLAVGSVMMIPFLLTIVGTLAATFLQTGFLVTAEQLKPKMEKISLIKGFERLFSTRSLVEFAKGIAKLAIVGLVIFLLVWPERDVVPNLVELTLVEILDLMRWMGLKIVGGVLAVMTVIAVFDFAFQAYKHNEEQRMSRQEVKDEHKQTEGDPQVKQRLRQLRMEKSRKRMMSEVPKADVVVTNPTHYAVALAYQQGQMAAPKLVAKGIDRVAARIREVAEENGIPVMQNPPLARALYSGVEIDQEVPPEHYKAVAQIIGYVMRLKKNAPITAKLPETMKTRRR